MSGQVERSKQLDSIDQCTKDIKEDTKQILGCLRGKEAPVDPNQSDKDRLKEIRLIKRNLENEVGDIKEREAEPLSLVKKAHSEGVSQAAEMAEDSVQMAADNFALEGKNLPAQKALVQQVIILSSDDPHYKCLTGVLVNRGCSLLHVYTFHGVSEAGRPIYEDVHMKRWLPDSTSSSLAGMSIAGLWFCAGTVTISNEHVRCEMTR